MTKNQAMRLQKDNPCVEIYQLKKVFLKAKGKEGGGSLDGRKVSL